MGQHLVRAIADEDLLRGHVVIRRQHLAQPRRLRIGIEPKRIGRGGSDGLDGLWRRTERALIGVELDEARNLRLLARNIRRQPPGEF